MSSRHGASLYLFPVSGEHAEAILYDVRSHSGRDMMVPWRQFGEIRIGQVLNLGGGKNMGNLTIAEHGSMISSEAWSLGQICGER